MYKNKNNFIAIIPARSGSKEVKNKNVIKINGHPLIAYSVEAAKNKVDIEQQIKNWDKKSKTKISQTDNTITPYKFK